ncbi:unnamed protein product, partial [Tuber aestivum]
MDQRTKRRGPVNEAGWYSPTMRLSGVVVRSRETKEKRKSNTLNPLSVSTIYSEFPY